MADLLANDYADIAARMAEIARDNAALAAWQRSAAREVEIVTGRETGADGVAFNKATADGERQTFVALMNKMLAVADRVSATGALPRNAPNAASPPVNYNIYDAPASALRASAYGIRARPGEPAWESVLVTTAPRIDNDGMCQCDACTRARRNTLKLGGGIYDLYGP